MALQSEEWWVAERSPDWLLSTGWSKPATSNEADGVHGCKKSSDHMWPSHGQREEIVVGRSHPPQVPIKVISSERGIDFLHEAPAQRFASKVFVGMPRQGSMHSMFDAMPLEVTWDEEMQADINTHEGLLQQLILGVDAELLQHIDSQDGLLQQLAYGVDDQNAVQEGSPNGVRERCRTGF